MRSQAGTSKTRKVAAMLCGSITALALTACTTQQRTAMLLPPTPYLALYTSAGPVATVHESGYFAQENGCVVFRTSEGPLAVTPVFSAGAADLVTDGSSWLGMYVKDAPVVFGKPYRLAGAVAPQNGFMTLRSPAPGGCPRSYFVVQNVGRALSEQDAIRLCADAILCSAYRFD